MGDDFTNLRIAVSKMLKGVFLVTAIRWPYYRGIWTVKGHSCSYPNNQQTFDSFSIKVVTGVRHKSNKYIKNEKLSKRACS